MKASGGRVRSGAVSIASFVRNIESLQVPGDTAIAMVNEVMVPSGNSPCSGTTIRRRYTNVWMKRDGGWLLTARHANVICPGRYAAARSTLPRAAVDRARCIGHDGAHRLARDTRRCDDRRIRSEVP